MTLVLALIFSQTTARADDLVLTLPGDAVTAAMGEATTASLSGAPAVFGNPAGLSRVDVPSLSVMHTAYVENITYSSLAAARPFGFHNAVGAGVSYLNFGSLPSYDSSGVPMPSYAPKDLSARVGVAKSFLHTSVGASLFYLQSKIVDAVSAYGASLGIHQVWGPISWAAALENAGSAMKYATQSQPLPTQERLAVSLHLTPAWMLNVEAIKPSRDALALAAGNEFRWDFSDDLNLSLRAGYNTRDTGGAPGLNGLSAGAGFGWKDSMLHYAWVPFGDLGQTHRLSFEVYFGHDDGGSTSEREHRSRSLFTSNMQVANRSFAEPKAIRKAMKMPLKPWRKTGPGWRTAKDKMMTLLAQDALCSTAGARVLLTRIQGVVVLQTGPHENLWPRLRTGQYLFQGDKLRTYDSASADLVFSNGTKAQIGKNSVFTVETRDAICDRSVNVLEQGAMYMASDNGKELRVKTPFGDAIVSDSIARLNVDDKAAKLRVQKGAAAFVADDVTTPVQEQTTFLQTAKGRSTKINDGSEKDEPVIIAGPDPHSIPGRWDPGYAQKLQTEIMRLDSVPGLMLGEYVRDVTLRNELKLHIDAMQRRQADLREQKSGLANDVRQFTDLQKTLSQPIETDDDKVIQDRQKSLKQATRVVNHAQRQLQSVVDELKDSERQTRLDQEYLAQMPIVRMLNITTDDTTVPFEPRRAVLSDAAFETLDTIAASIAAMQPLRIVIEAHTDRQGSPRENKRLSQEQAAAVAFYFRRKNSLPARLFVTKGRGASQPLDTNGDATTDRNRRVEIWLELRGL
jgi:outer membrane protein OmpA-like peptidoglycan-associated protein